MAQNGFTPIKLYSSTTAAAAPTAGNLEQGELAINTNDGKLFYEDSTGVVQVLATKDTAAGSFTNLSYTGTLTGSTGVVNLGSGQVYKDASGNVGIGTSSPASRFAVVDPAGSATSISFLGSPDNQTGNWRHQLDNVGFNGRLRLRDSSNVETIRLDSAGNNYLNGGNVGIGTSSPASKVYVATVSSTLYGLISRTPVVGLTAGDYVNMASFADSRGTNNDGLRIVNVRDSTGSGVGDWETSSYRIRRSVDQNDAATGVQEEIVFGNNLLAFTTNGTERMRIDSSGRVQINTTASKYSATLTLVKGASNAYNITSSVTGTGSAGHIVFENNNADAVGTIFTSGSSTSYNTTSDYRLKENVAPMQNALATVAALKPCTYTWKADGSAGQGFIAHELQAVVPDCVTGAKDAVETVDDFDADGKKIGTKEVPRYQGVDTSFLVATLVSAIQEQQAIITQLQADVAALKGN